MPGQRPYTPKSTVAAEREMLALYLQAAPTPRPLTGPVHVEVVAVWDIPARWPRELRDFAATGRLPCTRKPDKDNIEKLVYDALNGQAWVDDAQITSSVTVKRYGSPARTEVLIEPLEGPEIPATPADKRRDQWVHAGQPPRPRRAKSANPSKSKTKKLPAALQRAVDKALGRDKPR